MQTKFHSYLKNPLLTELRIMCFLASPQMIVGNGQEMRKGPAGCVEPIHLHL